MGAFDDIDYETAKGIEDYLMAFINPTIDYDQAAKIFDKKADTIRTEVSRKLSPRKKIKHSSVRFRYLDLKNIIKK